MKKIIIAASVLFFCGLTAKSQIYVPKDPTVYGVHQLRAKNDSATHITQKASQQTNTTDTTAQIFVDESDGSLTYYYKPLGYVKVIGNNIRDTANYHNPYLRADTVAGHPYQLDLYAVGYADSSKVSNDSVYFRIVGAKDGSYTYSWVFQYMQGGGGGTSYTASQGVELIGSNFQLRDTLPDGFGGASRFMWVFSKGALRAGSASGNRWDYDSIGSKSVAFGNNTKASGDNSFAAGTSASAIGSGSFAFSGTANGTNSVAIGGTANGSQAISIWSGAAVNGGVGIRGTATGSNSTAIGVGAKAIGDQSISISSLSFSNSRAAGNASTTIGYIVTAKAYGGFTFGLVNDTTDNPSAISTGALATDRIFQVGNGIDSSGAPVYSNALTMLRNGNTGFNLLVPDSNVTVQNGIWGKRGVRFSALPTAAGNYAVRIDNNGNLSKADTSSGGGTPAGNTGNLQIKGIDGNFYTPGGDSATIADNGSGVTSLLLKGYLGIGTTTPTQKFVVANGSDGVFIDELDAGGGEFLRGLYNGATTDIIAGYNTLDSKYWFANGNYKFGASGHEFTGNLKVTGDISNESNVNLAIVSGYTSGFISYDARVAWIGDRNNDFHNVFIKVDDDNELVVVSTLAGTGTRAVLTDASGVLSAPVSDRTVKDSIKTLDYGLNTLMKLKPVSFYYKPQYKNFGTTRQVGFIAQDVQEVMPNSVYTNKSGKTKDKLGINKEDIIAVLVKSVQELSAKVDAQAKEIRKLKAKKKN